MKMCVISIAVIAALLALQIRSPASQDAAPVASDVSAARVRHYHSQVDVAPGMPAGVTVFCEDAVHTPHTIRLALGAAPFSPTFYSEMPKHDHTPIQQPQFALRMAYAELTAASAKPARQNRNSDEDPWLIISADTLDYLRMPDHRSMVASEYPRHRQQFQMIKRSQDVQLRANGQGDKLRDGDPYRYGDDLRIILLASEGERDLTDAFLKRVPATRKLTSLGAGRSDDGFNNSTLSPVDITDLVGPRPDHNIELEFRLKTSGVRLKYDIFCE